jgi:hypothetical protein
MLKGHEEVYKIKNPADGRGFQLVIIYFRSIAKPVTRKPQTLIPG